MAGTSTKIGVLLVNLGTPDAPTTTSIKRYLRQFLSDRRVVDLPPLLWRPFLRTVILPRRAPALSKLYSSIWTDAGSPLFAESVAQRTALAELLPEHEIVLGMTYGNPSIESALDALPAVDKLIIFPLFPQYSSTTTGAVWDCVSRYYAAKRNMPTCVFIRDYTEHSSYIHALKTSIQRSFERHGEPDLLLFSFHGLPQHYSDHGDPYPQRCELTKEHVAAYFPHVPCQMGYQSRFGRGAWLQPYTDKLLEKLPAHGFKHIQVICPGFSADCLETLEEIAIRGKETFLAAGGEKFHYIPALNHESSHIHSLAEVIKSYS